MFWNRSPKENMKYSQRPNLTTLSLPTQKDLIIPLTTNVPNNSTPRPTIKNPLCLWKGDGGGTPQSLTHREPAKLTPNSWRKELHTALASWQSQNRWLISSSAFRQSMQQKGLTSNILFLTSLSTVLTRPSKICQIKNLTFLWTLVLQPRQKPNFLSLMLLDFF